MIPLTTVLSALFTLVIGSYGFTWMAYKALTKRLDELEHNHFAALEDRVSQLDDRITWADRRSYGGTSGQGPAR